MGIPLWKLMNSHITWLLWFMQHMVCAQYIFFLSHDDSDQWRVSELFHIQVEKQRVNAWLCFSRTVQSKKLHLGLGDVNIDFINGLKRGPLTLSSTWHWVILIPHFPAEDISDHQQTSLSSSHSFHSSNKLSRWSQLPNRLRLYSCSNQSYSFKMNALTHHPSVINPPMVLI